MKDLFRFTRGERIASLILLILTVLVVVLFSLLRRDRIVNTADFSEFDSLVHAVMPVNDALKSVRDVGKEGSIPRKILQKSELRLSSHDPNKMTKDDWHQLGLSHHVILTILHYREAGGRFRKKKDLKNIYGMTDTCYHEISDYLIIPYAENRPGKRDTISGKKAVVKDTLETYLVREPKVLELNRADSADFSKFDGISPYLARRIIRYRFLLGGYTRKQQLKEVYGLKKDVYKKLKDFITVDTSLIRTMDINHCTEATLAKHPYLTSYEAKAIVFYRTKYKHIDSLGVLLKNHIVPEETFRKIIPYLKTGK